MNDPCGQLTDKYCLIGNAVAGRLEVLNDVKQLAWPAAHRRLMALGELVMWKKFFHQ